MKTMQLQAGAGATNRRMDSNQVTAGNVRRHYGISLVCAFLVTLGGCSAPAAAEATYKLLGRETGGYASKDDLPAIVNKALGPRATIADWDEIKARYGGSEAGLKAFCEKAGLAPNGSAWVTQGGKRFWQSQRQYLLHRADHKMPEDFMLHDQMQNNFLLLGSWFDARPILVKIIDYNAADAAKWAKWDQMLAIANSKDVSGLYTLVAVNGNKVPASVSHEGVALQVRSGTFTIKADGTCGTKTTFVPPSGSEVTREVSATYTRDGSKLTIQWQGAGTTTGTIQGNTFTMDNEGMLFTYKR